MAGAATRARRSVAGGLQCEACHGPGAAHVAKGSKKKLTINSFKPDSIYTPAQRNQACLSCHENGARTGWHAGAHERAGLACTDCHKMHVDRDPVLDQERPRPRSASAATSSSAPTSRRRRPIRCASA